MTSPSFTPIALRLSAMCAFMGYLTYRHSNETALLFVVFFYLIAMSVWAGIYAVRSRTDSVQSSQPSLTTSFADENDDSDLEAFRESDGIDMNVVDGFGRFYGHDYDYQD